MADMLAKGYKHLLTLVNRTWLNVRFSHPLVQMLCGMCNCSGLLTVQKDSCKTFPLTARHLVRPIPFHLLKEGLFELPKGLPKTHPITIFSLLLLLPVSPELVIGTD